MLRNYLMPGFALILLAVFAAPRSMPPGAEATGAVMQTAPSKKNSTEQKITPDEVPQIGGSKQLYSPKDVCRLAKYEMHEKLNEFGVDFPDQDESTTPAAAARMTATKPGPPVETMIALVPDPVHTHLALRFDRYVDVLQEALQDSTSEGSPGWIYVSQWLPWDPVPYQASQDPIDRTNNHIFDADRECAPGILIFRKNQYQAGYAEGKFLIVFLVGESPTSGILRQDQFIYALRSWHTILLRSQAGAKAEKEKKAEQQPAGSVDAEKPAGAKQAPPAQDNKPAAATDPDDTLRILGPSFSASLSTLNSLLLANKCPPGDTSEKPCFKRAQVVSGSVSTSRRVIYDSENFPGLKDAHFISMNESSDAIQQMLLNYLGAREHISPDQVAFVSEDETAFGNLLSSMANACSTVRSRFPDTDRSMLFHYPREISQLRNAYEKNSILHRPAQSQSSQNPNPQDLTLSLEDRHEEEDSVPSFADNQSPISEESVLSAITRAIDRENIRVAVINGTDVLDVIFVARYFSRNLPNVRVVVLNADLLFERSPDVSDFRGMLLADSYPLIPDNVFWTGRFMPMPDDQGQGGGDGGRAENDTHPGPFGTYLPERIFSSYETVGIYNAARLLEAVPLTFPRSESKSSSDHCGSAAAGRSIPPATAEPSETLWLAEYTDPFRGGNHPPLWLNAVGRGGFWPVALLDRYSTQSSTEGRTSLVDIPARKGAGGSGEDSIPPFMFDSWSPAHIEFGPAHFDHPVAQKLVVARLSVTCLLALFVLFGLILCTFARLERWPEYVFDIKGTNRERRGWIVLVIILSYSWLARMLVLDLPEWRFFNDPINCGLVFLQIVLLLFALWVISRALAEGQRWYWAWLLIALTTTTQFAFAWIKPGEFSAKIFYLYRSEHFFNGVSPGVPFIFLCIALICLVSRHIHSLLIFSPRLMPRIPCYERKSSPEILRSIHRCAINDMLRACYSPWRMLASKLTHLASEHKKHAKGSQRSIQSAQLLQEKEKQLWKNRGCPPVGNTPKLTLVLLGLTLAIFLVSAYLLFPRGFETFETRSYAILLSICSFAILIVLLHEIGWVILMWICLDKGLLNPLERTTLRACFSRASGFSWQRLWFAIDLSPAVRFKPLFRAYESMLRIETGAGKDARDREEATTDTGQDTPEKSYPITQKAIGRVKRQYAKLMNDLEPGNRVTAFAKFQVALCGCASTVIGEILSDVTRQKNCISTSLDVPAAKIDEVLKESAKNDPLGANAEEFVGLVYIYGIQHILMDIRSHILAFTFGYFFLLLALTVYPVGPHHSIMVMMILIFTGFVIVAVVVFSQMHRDAILSRTTSTEPGKLDIGFYEKLISVLGVPIIGLLASQFPEISNFLFSWLEPSLQTLK